MLTLMESGQGNASLATTERVADALGVPFTTLVKAPSAANTEVVTGERATTMWSGADGSVGASFFTSSRHRGIAELWEWSLAPGETYAAEPDPAGSEELIYVTSGRLRVTSRDGDIDASRRRCAAPGQRPPVRLPQSWPLDHEVRQDRRHPLSGSAARRALLDLALFDDAELHENARGIDGRANAPCNEPAGSRPGPR